MKRRTLLASLPIFAFGAATLVLPGMATAQVAGMLRIRLNSDIRSTDPGINRDANTDYLMSHIVEGLVGFQDNADIAPMLAEKWDISEDGKTYTFTLRDGVTFHNGAPLTSAEVLFCWNRYMQADLGWRGLPEFNGENGLTVTIAAPDARTVIFTLSEPSSLFLVNLARIDCAQTGIYHPDSLGSDGKFVAPIGTGPFKMAKWERAQYIELEKFDAYAALSTPRSGLVGDKTPLVDRVRFMIVPEDSSAKTAVLAGDIDIIPDISTSDYTTLKSSAAVKIDVVESFSVAGFLFQTKDPLLGKPEMRQAIKLALDAPQIVDIISEGLSKANQSIVPPGSAFYSQVMAQPFERDLERARSLAKAAGYKGEVLPLLTTKHYPQLFDMAIMAQAMLAEAGILVDVQVLDWATLFDRYGSGNYQIATMTYSARLDPTLSYDMISGDKAEEPRKVWDNPEARKLLDQTKRETRHDERAKLFDQIETLFQKDQPMIPLYSGNRISARTPSIDGYASWPVGSPRAWGVTVKAGM